MPYSVNDVPSVKCSPVGDVNDSTFVVEDQGEVTTGSGWSGITDAHISDLEFHTLSHRIEDTDHP